MCRDHYGAFYREANREKARTTTAKWRAENPDRTRALMEAYRARPENQKAARDRAREFRLANPDLRSEYERRRRAYKKSSVVGMISPRMLSEKFELWGNRCWMCGGTDDLQADHVKPLSKGGPHMLANIRPACRPCNTSKSDRWPYPTGKAA